MATIEERAYAAVGHPKPPKGSMITAEKLTWDEQIFRNGYIKGATEQKQIDIDKAVEWLRENIRPWYKFSIDTFRKAMTKEE